MLTDCLQQLSGKSYVKYKWWPSRHFPSRGRLDWLCAVVIPILLRIARLNKHCAPQKFDDPNGTYSRTRAVLFQKLLAHSSRTKFYKMVVMGVDNQHDHPSLSGLFQCRGDLDERMCNECVKAMFHGPLTKSSGGCGESLAGRVQLSGCHMKYEADRYEPSSRNQVSHKTCGEAQAVAPGGGYFEQARSQAFEALESGIASQEAHGFYTVEYGAIHALAQCEVGVGGCECVKCVVDAIGVAEEECSRSVSGQIFMDLCFLSYEFQPNGLPSGRDDNPEGKGGGRSSGKLVAITVGGAAFLALALVFFRFIKKKTDD